MAYFKIHLAHKERDQQEIRIHVQAHYLCFEHII